VLEGFATFDGERVKRAQRWTVVGPEEGHVFFGRAEAEDGRP
jgi:hypothetical protein